MVDEQKLRQLAEAATPGIWIAGGASVTAEETEDCPGLDAKLYGGNGQQKARNSRYIAAANPAAILSMLDELQALREERTEWRVTAENAEAAVTQARIDALEEAKQACEREADEFRCGRPGSYDGRYDWKEDGLATVWTPSNH